MPGHYLVAACIKTCVFLFNVKHQQLFPLRHYGAFWVNRTRQRKMFCGSAQTLAQICVETHPVHNVHPILMHPYLNYIFLFVVSLFLSFFFFISQTM